ncbi:MAG: glycosyltransferase, partial [Bdellovibrionales bacterium]|nr:glycosyltransferase [Bdellovibrionales bacterium]
MKSSDLVDLSIIIPARNEELALPHLLESLAPAFSLGAQIIIVDDNSSDRTLQIAQDAAERFRKSLGPKNPPRIEAIQAPPKPPGWSGKNWACHLGAKHALNPFLLFTDADTLHSSQNLLRALDQIQDQNGQLLTSLPFHVGTSFWERSLAIFHLLLIQSTRPGLAPQMSRLYANGQFLLFQKEKYEYLGGHASVKKELCEDLMLAKRILESGSKLLIAPSPLYHVKMYPTLREFIAG